MTTTTDTGFEILRLALEAHGSRVTGNGSQLSAQCPAHDDRSPSLSIKDVPDQAPLMFCHAGCQNADILAAVNLTWSDLYPQRDGVDYRYGDGRVVHRTPDKRFWQGGNRQGNELYRLSRVREAVAAGQTIYVTEGEKDVLALETLGVTATCSAMGAGKASKADWIPLSGANVVVIADRDEPGERHAADVRRILRRLEADVEVRIAAVGKDAADHVAAGYGVDDLVPSVLPEDTDIAAYVVGNPVGHAIASVYVGEPRPGAIELDDYLAEGDEEYDWLVPGLLERGDRLILTGAEGGGKSTLLRQLGVQLASGIHPFSGEAFNPLRVLLLDLENSDRQTKRKLRPLRLAASDSYRRGNMHVRARTQGIDLLVPADVMYLADLVAETTPDVLITGPAYKMAGGDPNEEKTARPVAAQLDRIRAEYGCAVLLESHSPHASNGGKRPDRPFGASLWLRWPEFGLHLDKDTGALRHWRGDREERDWPAALQRGGTWPWSPITRPRDLLWARLLEVLVEDPGLSRRDLAKLTGASLGAVNRAIDEHRSEYDRLTEEAR